MRSKLTRNILAIAIGALGGLLAAADLIAQDPSPKPTPFPLPTTRPIPTTQPTVKQPQPNAVELDAEALRRPDLQVALSPRAMSSPPSAFTVRNAGAADATTASLLRVTIRVLPLEDQAEGVLLGLESLLSRLDGTGAIGGFRTSRDIRPAEPNDGPTNSDFESLCVPPFADFAAAIDPLNQGESQVVSTSGTRPSGFRQTGVVGARPSYRVPTHSYLREIEVRLVCVYELRAMVDANREVEELNEANNEVVHIFQREVRLR